MFVLLFRAVCAHNIIGVANDAYIVEDNIFTHYAL
jgi:hypothetical protein